MLQYKVELLTKLADYYGQTRTISEGMQRAYGHAMRELPEEKIGVLFRHFAENKEIKRFPRPFEINQAIREILPSVVSSRTYDPQKEACRWCNDSGLVPVIYYPEIYNGHPTLTHLVCNKCRVGNKMFVKATNQQSDSFFQSCYTDVFEEQQIPDNPKVNTYAESVYLHYANLTLDRKESNEPAFSGVKNLIDEISEKTKWGG